MVTNILMNTYSINLRLLYELGDIVLVWYANSSLIRIKYYSLKKTF